MAEIVEIMGAGLFMVRVCGFGRVCNPSRILIYSSGLVSGWSLGFHGSVLCFSDSTCTIEKKVLF
jgi:hypothetical protein